MRPNTLTHKKHSAKKQSAQSATAFLLDARNHYPTLKHHTPPPSRATTTRKGVLSQSPIVCPMIFSPAIPARHVCCAPSPAPTTAPGSSRLTIPRWDRGYVVLLRKEVIQPHLPVRLPCYDFVPIADPTFDHSLPCGLGHGLRVLPTFMT